jgi:hypothetical protein
VDAWFNASRSAARAVSSCPDKTDGRLPVSGMKEK